MTQKQSVKQTPGVRQEVKVVIGDSVLLKSGRRKKAARKKKPAKKPAKLGEFKPVQPTVPTGTRSQTFGNQLFASPPQFLRPAPSPVEPIQPVRKELEVAQPTRRETEAADLRKRAEEATKRVLTRRATEPFSPTFVERRGAPIPEPIRSFVTPQQPSRSLSDMIRRQATESPVPVIRVPSFRIDSPSDISSAPNQANQPSVDVSRPDPALPSPQAPAGAPLVAAQPVIVRPMEIGGIRGFDVSGDMFGGGDIRVLPRAVPIEDSDVEND